MKAKHEAVADAQACIEMLPAMANYYKLPRGRSKFKKAEPMIYMVDVNQLYPGNQKEE